MTLFIYVIRILTDIKSGLVQQNVEQKIAHGHLKVEGVLYANDTENSLKYWVLKLRQQQEIYFTTKNAHTLDKVPKEKKPEIHQVLLFNVNWEKENWVSHLWIPPLEFAFSVHYILFLYKIEPQISKGRLLLM